LASRLSPLASRLSPLASPESSVNPVTVRILSASLALGVLYAAACATSSSMSSAPSPAANMSTSPPTPDPRIGLRPGRGGSASPGMILARAAETSWNLRLVSNSPPTERFGGVTNSDIAFPGKYAIQGNYNGYQVWDVSDVRR